MVLTDVGLNETATRFANEITKAQWGTGTATPTTSDTGLGSAIPSTLLDVTSTTSGTSAQFTHTVPSTEANGYELTEFDLRFDDGTNLNRTLGGAISKTSAFEVVTISTINFVRG